ncbi:hypothetical protein [Pseudomonas syringae]|uniref:hypothetical protein n=1 Tax=Pseudomonas syringae TaxID=317 RepID=UPI00200A619E|nr:hypothetical protein [Pseudomonas syringae]MCK9704969.1 hypothetical protein [Pseudomonas syringae pv. syringae]
MDSLLAALAKILEDILSTEVFIALIAAYIGAAATSRAADKSHHLAKQKATQDEIQLTNNTLKLIRTEITTAWNIFIFEYGSDLLELDKDQPYICVFPIGHNTFPIYDSSPACLANIEPALAEKIVRTYMRTKGLISMINMNNAHSEAAINTGRSQLIEFQEAAILDNQPPMNQDERDLRYGFLVRQEAIALGMADNANGMRSVAKELAVLIQTIDSQIDTITRSPT